MGLSARERAQADLAHFGEQLESYRARLDENDAGHVATIVSHQTNAQAAFDERSYRKVGPRLRLARDLIQHVVGEPVTAKPQNQLTMRRQLQRLWAKCFGEHRGLKIGLALGTVGVCLLAGLIGPNLHHAYTVRNARNAVVNALGNGGYASQGQVLAAADLPPGYRFYVGPEADIQQLPPREMAWTSPDAIEGFPGKYGIPPGNSGIGSTSGVTDNNDDAGYGSDNSTILIINTGKGGFVAVAFICSGYASQSSTFQRDDTPVRVTLVSMDCASN